MTKKKKKGANKAKGGRGNLSSKIVSIFKQSPKSQFSYKQIVIRLKRSATKGEVVRAIDVLLHEGRLQQPEKNKLILSRSMNVSSETYEGVVDMTQQGAGFIVIPALKDDVYVAASNLGGAMDGDQVRIKLFTKTRSRRLEGAVEEVTGRAQTAFIGTVVKRDDKWFVESDNLKMRESILIEEGKQNGAKEGDKVIISVTDWRSGRFKGEVVEALGKPGTVDIEMRSILLEHGFPLHFPDKAMEETEAFSIEIPESALEGRKDFRDVLTFTIDPVDAKDFDDALSYRILDNGNMEVGVHIADVTHYIREDSALEKEAAKRATSVYLPDRVLPMLPEKLSNGLCSLRPDEEKLTYAAVFELDQDANIKEEWFGRTIIKSNRRFTYEDAQQVILGKSKEYGNEINSLNTLAGLLRKKRFENGSINFESSEVRFELNDDGKPTGIVVKERFDAHMLVEDFMLLANKRVAEFISSFSWQKKQVPGVYRVHDYPDDVKLENFKAFASKFGYDLNVSNPKEVVKSLNQLMEEIRGKAEQDVLEKLAIRSMAKAYYTTNNIGHYGLGFDHYSHFTSPIRRYPDMMTHRILQRCLDKVAPVLKHIQEDKCKNASVMERRAVEAERAARKYMQVLFIQDKKGEIFEGVISGIMDWGIFVEVIENKCEGLIRVESLKEDVYVVNEKEFCVTGKRFGKTYVIGDKVTIKILDTDLKKRTIDMEMVEDQGEASKK